MMKRRLDAIDTWHAAIGMISCLEIGHGFFRFLVLVHEFMLRKVLVLVALVYQFQWSTLCPSHYSPSRHIVIVWDCCASGNSTFTYCISTN